MSGEPPLLLLHCSCVEKVMPQSLLPSIASLLTHHILTSGMDFNKQEIPPAASETAHRIAELDALFVDIVGSIRDDNCDNPETALTRKHFDSATVSVARLVSHLEKTDQPAAVHDVRQSGPFAAHFNVALQPNTPSPLGHQNSIHTPLFAPVVTSFPSSPSEHSPSPIHVPALKKKRFRRAVPSTHCHICCRPSRSVPVAICANINDGTCRKVICNLCVNEYNLGVWEHITTPNTMWQCTHCVDACSNISRAQCFVYSRTNLKRKLAGVNKRQKPRQEPLNVVAAVATRAWVDRSSIDNSRLRLVSSLASSNNGHPPRRKPCDKFSEVGNCASSSQLLGPHALSPVSHTDAVSSMPRTQHINSPQFRKKHLYFANKEEGYSMR